MLELGRLFKCLLEKNEIATSPLVLPYLASRQADRESGEKIQMLAEMVEKERRRTGGR